MLVLGSSFPAALLLGGEEEAMPAKPCYTHSEDLPWLEVPHPLPAAEEEPDSGVSVVPPICGEALWGNAKLKSVPETKLTQQCTPFSFSISQQQKKYKKIKSATTVVQSYTRGWQVCTSPVNSLCIE